MRRVTHGLMAAAIALSLGALTPGLATAAPQTPVPPYTPAYTDKDNQDGIPRNGDGPVVDNFQVAQLYSLLHPGTNPAGANDFNCQPKPGELPLILLTGTGEDAYKVWGEWSPKFKNMGYCVFAPNLNNTKGMPSMPYTGDIIGSAEAFGKFVQMVLKATHAEKVNIIGHSQGAGTLPLAYFKWFDGTKYVNKMIGLAPGNHGTSIFGVGDAYYASGAAKVVDPILKKRNMQGWTQQFTLNPFNKQLDANNINLGDVQYTAIMTKYDDIITPYTSGYLTQAGVRNIVIQDICSEDYTDHLSFTYDPVAFQVVTNVLQGRPAKENVKCQFVPPAIA